MKKIFLVILMAFSLTTLTTLSAKGSELIFEENVTYFESKIENGEVTKKEITEKEALDKLKFKQYIKRIEKKFEKELKEIEKSKNEVYNNDEAITEIASLSSLMLVVDDGGGGGGGSTSLIVYANDSTTKVYCTLSTYTYCKGYAETIGSITKLVTSVSMNPNSTTGLHLKNVLTWYDAPTHSITDYMSLGYHGTYLDPDRDTLEGSVHVEYEGIERYWWGGISSRTPYTYDESFEYESNKDVIEIEEHGVLWDIETVYRDYSTGSSGPTGPVLFDNNGVFLFEVDVNKIIYTLETDLDLLGHNGTYTSYDSHIKLPFSGDYRHSYYGITVTTNLVFRAYLGTNPASFINISVTPTIKADGTRKNDIEVYF